MNTGKISPGAILEWKEARRAADHLEGQIIDRITYIIRFWMEAFGGKLDTWYFDNAGESEVGDLRRHMNDNNIHSIVTICKPYPKPNYGSDMLILNRDGEEFGWQSEIPTRWLYEDFESEIINGKTLFEAREKQRQEEKALRKKNRKATDDALAESAKSKLTKEELAALRRTL